MPLSLSSDRIDAWDRDGLLWPLSVLDARACERYRRQFDELDAAVGGATDVAWTTNLHLHLGWCHDLVTEPRILDAVEDLLGPDLLVLSSILFVKKPGEGRFVSWHQDSRFFHRDGRRLRALSAWIALAPSTLENGCLLGIPGSHRDGYLPHDCTYDARNMLRRGETLRVPIDETRAVAMTLDAGEMSVHHIDTVHASHTNEGRVARIGLAVRYMHPETVLTIEHAPAVLARGRDVFGHHDLAAGRPTDDLEAALASIPKTIPAVVRA